MLIFVNWAHPMYGKSKEIYKIPASWEGNDPLQLVHYIGRFLDWCFETVKINQQRSIRKVIWNGTKKSHFRVFLKLKTIKIFFPNSICKIDDLVKNIAFFYSYFGHILKRSNSKYIETLFSCYFFPVLQLAWFIS